MTTRKLMLVVAALGLAVPITLTATVSTPDGAADAISNGSITIDLLADRAQPFGHPGILAVNGDVHWRNRSGETRTITSPDGLLDSGPIPDGGSFHASLPLPGSYEWQSEFGSGTIVVEADFTGSDDDLALDHIPFVFPAEPDDDEIALHPELAIEIPMLRAIVGFSGTATVAEARQALGTSWDIIGGLPATGLVYAQIWLTSAPTSFAALDARIDQLRSHPAVDFVAYDIPFEESNVAPPSADAESVGGYWEPPQSHPLGARTNWGLELAKVPQAWNLLDASRANGGQDRAGTVVVDSGFEEHIDLTRLQQLQLCGPWAQDSLGNGRCTTTAPGDHGNHVAGIIGADFDEIGVTGIDPLSRLYGVPWKFERPFRDDAGRLDFALELVLQEMLAGRLADIGVINLSVQLGRPDPGDWWASHGDQQCGPGADDDSDPIATVETCVPSNHDPTIRAREASSEVTQRIVERYVQQLADPPLFVNSTGNAGAMYCEDQLLECLPGTGIAQRGTVLSAFTWANANWDSFIGENPILSTESIGNIVGVELTPQLDRSEFSNLDGDISTSGLTVSTETSAGSGGAGPCQALNGPDTYCYQNGTSQAAPAVSAAAGLLLGWAPDLTAAQLKDRLTTWAVPDTLDRAAPRLDVYASLISLDGAAHALTDVNDPSIDGNRRVVMTIDGSTIDDVTLSTTPGFTTNPDGVVDLRDFRRFRDAWLLRCQISPEPGCPEISSISLDGGDAHPKRDLNGDGCILLSTPAKNQPCPSELTFPRVDFNGDGTVSLGARSRVPLRQDGTAAANPGEATMMTDLQVFQSQYDSTAPGALGVSTAQLGSLMTSGDLTLVADGLVGTGAPTAAVTLVDATTEATIGSYELQISAASDDDAVVTVASGRSYRLDVEAIGPTGACSLSVGPFEVRPGEDRRIDLDTSLGISIDPPSLRPGESATATVSAASCNGDVTGIPVEVALSPDFADGADVPVTIVTIGADGTGTTAVDAGDRRAAYELTASATVPVDDTTSRDLTARTFFTVGEAYDVEVAAFDGAGSGWAALDEFTALGVPIGPSVNASGDIAFGALAVDDDRYRPYVTQPGDAPEVPADATVYDTDLITAGTELVGDVELNDAGQLVYSTLSSSGTDVTRGVYRADPAGFTDEIATSLSTLGATTEPYSRVTRPTMNENGRVLFVATDQSGDESLAERTAGIVVTGPRTLGARPRLADDGTSVAEVTTVRDCASYPGVCGPGQTQLFDPVIVVGADVQPTSFVIAEGRVDGFGSMSAPDISATGDAVAFVADRNGTAGLFVALRRSDGTWQPPIAVEGPHVTGRLVTLVRDRPSVVQLGQGADGLADDRLLISVRGSDTGDEAVFVIPVDVAATGDATFPFLPTAQNPKRVAGIGDVIGGRTLARLDLGDALALAATPGFADDHWVAFYAEATDGSNVHLRARALAEPTAAASPGGPGNALMVRTPYARPKVPQRGPFHIGFEPYVGSVRPAPANVLPDDVVVLPGPHIAAVTVDDDTPDARVPSRIVNRSRSFDGTPAWGIADENASNPDVLVNPEAVGPDSELLVVYPNRGVEWLSLGAPLTAGEFANDVRFRVDVQPGENRPPSGQLDGPYVVAPGSDLSMRITGVDPDGDSLSYSWDLDDDSAFDDSTSTFVSLSASDVESIVCGGTCVLEQPYPVAVRVLDVRGLDAVVTSTITVSGFEGIVLRADPTLLQANPGSVARAYVFVDKPPTDPPSTVALSIENAPDGWTISLSGQVQSGSETTMSIRVPDDELEGSFTFDVVARLGDIERRVTMTVVTQFGLIPECTARVQGVVTDETGNPVENASLDPSLRFGPTVRTDATGAFGFDVVLSQGSTVERFVWTLTGPSGGPLYVVQSGGPQYATCGETTEFNPVLRIVPEATGLTMRAVEGLENPVTPTRPLATDAPLDGVTFRISYRPDRFTIVEELLTPTDGVVTFGNLPTSSTFGGGLTYSVAASKPGYWSATRNIRLSDLDAGELVDAGDFPLVPACSGLVTTARVVDQFGDPVPDARVRITSPNLPNPLITDADGLVTFDETVFLATFNRPRFVSVRADSPSDWQPSDSDFETKELSSCDQVLDQFELELERPEPEVDYFATLLGTVTDRDTGEPIAGARVGGSSTRDSFSTTTDDDGNWSAEVFLGTDPATVAGWSVSVTNEPDYWLFVTNTSVPVDSEVRVDAQLTRRIQVTLTGQVTDAETGEPVEGARVLTAIGANMGGSEDRTDSEGRYTLDGLLLDQGAPGFTDPNGPRNTVVQGDFEYFGAPVPTPYWRVGTEFTLTAEGPNVLDFQMIPVCDDASVSGLVVNAQTLEPLEDVEVIAGGVRTFTDAQGRYSITGIRPGRDNAPLDTTVFARKDGFFDASIDITTYCGAELIVDFGRPFGGFGTVNGTVTDSTTGDPIPDVFVGSSWGDSTTTATDGTYSFDRAPLTSDGGDRDWTISATRGFDRLQRQVTVSADVDAVADFEFGAANAPPSAFGQSISTDAETPVDITLTGNDPEGAPLTYAVLDVPTLGSLSGTAPDLTYTPNGTPGDDTFTFQVSDGSLDSEVATVNISVADVVNTAPRLNAPAALNVAVDSTIQFGLSADDDEGDDLVFSLVDDADGRAAITDSGTGTASVTFTPRAGDEGSTFDVGVEVTDGDLGDAATVAVAVDAAVNRSPEIEIDAPDQADEGSTVTFDASATSDPDGDALTFAWALIDVTGATVDTSTGPVWSRTFDDDFAGAARLTVTDARGETAMAEAEILIVNVPPAVEAEISNAAAAGDRLVEAVVATPGEQVEVRGTFTDPGADTHEATVDWGDGTIKELDITDASYALAHVYANTGSYTVVIEVCDDDGGCGRAGDDVVIDDAGVNPPSVATTTTQPTAPTATPAPTTSPTPAPTTPPTPAAILPATGSTSSPDPSVAVFMVVLGAALLVVAKRRRGPTRTSMR